MPYRTYQAVNTLNKNESIGVLNVGPYIFNIYPKNHDSLILFSKVYNFTFYDETNHVIIPPLVQSNITITYTEFRDLLCYLNLPVFRSTRNRNILFFPNYDLHQRLLEIQGLPRNYSDFTGKSIDWNWFKEGETAAKEAITCFCQEYEESESYGIEPVEYVWYNIVYTDSGNIKKFIFLVVPFEDLAFYKGSDIYKRDGKYYICNKDEVPEHMIPQLQQFHLQHVNYIWIDDIILIKVTDAEYPEKEKIKINKSNYIYNKPPSDEQIKEIRESSKSLREKYLKYKIKYLNLKKLLQKNNNL
jgi:hypothetical protein